jgi:ribosomal protein S27AE
MYSWDEDTSGWYGSGKYAYGTKGAEEREEAARRAALAGGRSYERRGGPNEAMVDAKRRLRSESRNPLVVAVDVTGSMANWPFEIFDRLPLFYNTLSQYREDLEVVFAAIGDAGVDRFPIQVTEFAKGYDLEQQLGALWGEGGGGDAPESYGLFAHWLLTHVEIPNAAETPFLVVFGDAPMHEKVPGSQIQKWLGDHTRDVDAVKAWQQLGQKWNTWFLRRPTGRKGDEVHRQWAKAVGEKKILTIDDEQRAVDYAMGIVARAWGHFEDFKNNMRARQPEDKVEKLSAPIAMICPRCGGPVPEHARGMFKCGYCGITLKI